MTSVRLTFDTMPPGRRLAMFAAAVLAVFVLLVLGCAAVLRLSGATVHHDRVSGTSLAAAPPVVAPKNLTTTLTPQQSSDVDRDIASLSGMPSVAAATSVRYPAIPDEQRSQPDLYARAFATELLTQDYQTARAELLAWVQSEAAATSEPRVVGLVPVELRDRFALWSVTSATDGSPTPIPSVDEWRAWSAKQAYTSVQIVRVVESMKWASAVASGELSDPGVTARDVEANVTLHWRAGKTVRTSTRSVTLSLDLEGPPSRAGFGFVDAVTYAEVPVN